MWQPTIGSFESCAPFLVHYFILFITFCFHYINKLTSQHSWQHIVGGEYQDLGSTPGPNDVFVLFFLHKSDISRSQPSIMRQQSLTSGSRINLDPTPAVKEYDAPQSQCHTGSRVVDWAQHYWAWNFSFTPRFLLAYRPNSQSFFFIYFIFFNSSQFIDLFYFKKNQFL